MVTELFNFPSLYVTSVLCSHEIALYHTCVLPSIHLFTVMYVPSLELFPMGECLHLLLAVSLVPRNTMLNLLALSKLFSEGEIYWRSWYQSC